MKFDLLPCRKVQRRILQEPKEKFFGFEETRGTPDKNFAEFCPFLHYEFKFED